MFMELPFGLIHFVFGLKLFLVFNYHLKVALQLLISCFIFDFAKSLYIFVDLPVEEVNVIFIILLWENRVLPDLVHGLDVNGSFVRHVQIDVPILVGLELNAF